MLRVSSAFHCVCVIHYAKIERGGSLSLAAMYIPCRSLVDLQLMITRFGWARVVRPSLTKQKNVFTFLFVV